MRYSLTNNKNLPVKVGVALYILIFILWLFLDNQRDSNLNDLLDIRANEFSSHIEADIRSRIPVLQRIAQRWKVRVGTPKAEFVQDVNNIVKDLPGFQALSWVDKSFYVRWIAPLKGNEEALNLNLGFEKNRRIALEIARDKGMPTMTAPITLVQGGKGFLIYIPIFVNKEFDGFISAVFRVNQWLDYVFSLNTLNKEKNNTKVVVQLDNEQVYAQKGWDENGYPDWQAISNINILDRVVSVTVVPTESFFEDKWIYVPEIVAAIGLLLSSLIAIMIFLLQKTNAAIQQAHNINTALEENIEVRKRAEHEAKIANEAKSKFLSSMSHELRTPMNVIMGYGQLLTTDPEAPLSNSQKVSAEEILAGGRKLLTLIENILLFTEVTDSKVFTNPEVVDVKGMVEECIEIFRADAEARGIELAMEFSPGHSPAINIDPHYGREIIKNFLSNAIQYNHDNGSVTINILSTKDERLRITVTDTGQGIPEAYWDEVFLPFHRLNMEASSISGTGIGLAISKSLAEFMGGKVGFESKEGAGSTFWVDFPINQSGSPS